MYKFIRLYVTLFYCHESKLVWGIVTIKNITNTLKGKIMKALILLIGLLIGLLMMASVHAEQSLFNVLAQDKNLIRDIRSEGDNVWIKLTVQTTK